MSARRGLAAAFLIWMMAAGLCSAQPERYAQWINDLKEFKDASNSAQRESRIAQLREEVQQWIGLNPRSMAALPPATDRPWSQTQAQEQIVLLKTTLDKLIKSDQAFAPGVTVVNVTAPGVVLSPATDSIDQADIQNHDGLTVDQAIKYLPGVSVDHKSPRGQTGISIGGFDIRQVPLYIDGIPAYVPFDGGRLLVNAPARLMLSSSGCVAMFAFSVPSDARLALLTFCRTP